MCLSDGRLDPARVADFRQFCHLLESVFHFEFHQRLERLKNLYAPVDPDSDTLMPDLPRSEEKTSLTDELRQLLDLANYEQLETRDIEEAFEASSLFQVKLKIELDDYREVLLFVRGESEKTEKLSWFFGLLNKEITFTNYDRVVLYIRFREDIAPELARDRPGATMLKLFQNVPRADIEMLFPNTRVAMRNVDKLLIGLPAVAGAVAILTTKAGASLLLLASLLGFWLGLHGDAVELDQATLIAILAGVAGLGSYIWKQFSNFRNRKLMFMQSLTQSLYFKNLDNNAGVFHRLIDDAEEEECKEAILAYYFLLASDKPLSEAALDSQIESWFESRWQVCLDFEVSDALRKLESLGLLNDMRVPSPGQACQMLDQRWDAYFNPAKGD